MIFFFCKQLIRAVVKSFDFTPHPCCALTVSQHGFKEKKIFLLCPGDSEMNANVFILKRIFLLIYLKYIYGGSFHLV